MYMYSLYAQTHARTINEAYAYVYSCMFVFFYMYVCMHICIHYACILLDMYRPNYRTLVAHNVGMRLFYVVGSMCFCGLHLSLFGA